MRNDILFAPAWGRRLAFGAFLLMAGLLVAGCADESDKPYLRLAGGGFIFNYRISEMHYGVVLAPERALPEGGKVEASFENPAGGGPIVLSAPVTGTEKKFVFDTPALSGTKKDRPYHVAIVLMGPDGAELQRIEKDFTSSVEQADMPDRPLTVGPGYTPNVTGQKEAFTK
ncbi:hypothetical protein [Afifella sp. IM 167]|uniref:hypothetical protein n=1 Tax=Afifella sp. IM 167 TaxID=2033586 RepID=UPI001CCA6376|nr:hypothetical protein [Afifella sp. IM 167]MBZ8132689.1 hypothetical protein [Afifella sp. IM 167]